MMAAKSQSPQNIDSEVVEQAEKARRRRFSASYKLKILEAVDGCSTSSERGQILREEGLYRSHLAT